MPGRFELISNAQSVAYEGEGGPQGNTGSQGIQGNTGTQGDIGPSGAQGNTGSQGIQGVTGTQGIQGNTGAQGNTGSQGIQGDTGTQGIQGNTGTQGNTGSQGIQGNTGSQGIQGDPGAQGIQGNTGATGNTGSQGIQGNTGPAGGGFNTLRTTADQTINAGAATFVDITGLTFAVTSGVDYAFHFYITFRSAATTTGWKAGVNHPGGTLDFWMNSDQIANGAAGVATHVTRHNTAVNDMTLLTATITAGVDLAIIIEGRYKCTVTGAFAARFANELAADTNLVVQKGSWGWYF